MTYREITVSAYVMTEDVSLATRVAEQLQAMMTGYALEGGAETVVKIGTVSDDGGDDMEFILPQTDDFAR
jgi:hypothetical protein